MISPTSCAWKDDGEIFTTGVMDAVVVGFGVVVDAGVAVGAVEGFVVGFVVEAVVGFVVGVDVGFVDDKVKVDPALVKAISACSISFKEFRKGGPRRCVSVISMFVEP
jgi:hypothetical protein